MLLRKLSRRVFTISAVVLALCHFVYSRPQVSIESSQDETNTPKPALVENINPINVTGSNEIRPSVGPESKLFSVNSATTGVTNDPRLAKTGTPVIGDSIKMVANQLLHSSTLSTQAPAESEIVEDVRTPPKMKNKIAMKQQHKNNVKNEEPVIENSHAGLAIPVTMEELEKDHDIEKHSEETSTSQAGLSTWILLSNPSSTVNPNEEVKPEKASQVNATDSFESTKDVKKTTTLKPKQPISKNRPTKKPQTSNTKPTILRRPIIASANKSDLIAGGSAVNENVLNKIKASVLANVQKNKNAALNRTTTPVPHTLISTSPEVILVTKNDFTTKRSTSVDKHNSASIQSSTEKSKIVKVKKQKHKNKRPVLAENKISAQLPMEAKDQEIELEVSTPSTTTKKPKRNSSKRKKNKTKKRKPSTPKPTTSELLIETKVNNNSKVAIKPTLKQKPISTQIYNYLSREVMPTVGVGIVGLAGLVGLASYFLYPFTGPVRRAYDIHDKKDDLYRHNAEDYAHDGNGQAEEDMLGTVLAGIPSNSNNRINPYVNQTPNRYPQNKKDSEQNVRYRNVAANNEGINQNTHYSQQKTGLAHGVVYSDPVSYDTNYETDNKNVYSEYAGADAVYSQQNTKSVYPTQNTQSGAIYPSQNSQSDIVYPSQSAPSGPTSFESQSVNSVYAMKPSQQSNFEPVYPFEGQVFSETTHNPISTSMYLGSDDESRHRDDQVYGHEENNNNPDKKPQFVVGNVPKELIQPITPAVVPEHGPRSLNRKKRSLIGNHVADRSIADAITEILKATRDEVNIRKLNEIDEALGLTTHVTLLKEKISTTEPKDVTILYVKPNIRTTNSQTSTVTDHTKHSRSTEIVSDSKYDFSTVPSNNFNELTNKILTRTSTVVAEDFLTNTNSGATTVLTTTSLEDRPLTVTGARSSSSAQTSTVENGINKWNSKLPMNTAIPSTQVSFNDTTFVNVQPSTVENKVTEDKTLSQSYIPTFSASSSNTKNKHVTLNTLQSSSLDEDILLRTRASELYSVTPESALTTLHADKTRASRKMKLGDTPSTDVQAHISLTSYDNGITKTLLTNSKTTDNNIFPSSTVDTSSDALASYQTVSGTQLKLRNKDKTSSRVREIPTSTVENISTHPLGTMYSYYNGNDANATTTTHKDKKIDTSTVVKDINLTLDQNDKTTYSKKNTEAKTTESELSNEIDVTTKMYKIYEVFTTTIKSESYESIGTDPPEFERKSTENNEPSSTIQTLTSGASAMTSTSPFYQKSTENEEEKTSGNPTVTSSFLTTTIRTEIPKNESPENFPENQKPITTTSVPPPSPSESNPNYPYAPTDHNHKPQNNFSVISFLKKLIEFKFRLGMSILQTTSESLARYLRGMESTMREVAKASGTNQRIHNE